MLFQLGNKQFEGVFSPQAWNYSGNEANLAQYELIGVKPMLQHMGETLEEVSLTLQLRADFCDLRKEISDLESWKKSGEILPLLLGNGDYLNDYVILGMTKSILQTFSDGEPIEISLNLNLIECSYSKIYVLNAKDKKNARAIGDKKQINKLPKQAPTSEFQAHKSLMEAQTKALETAELAQKTKESPKPEMLFSRVKNSVKEAQNKMSEARQKISDIQQRVNNVTGIISSINQAKDKLEEISTLMRHPISLNDLNDSILNLQSGIRGIDTNASVFTKDIILRKM